MAVRILWIAVLLALISSCATIQPPEGGEKDIWSPIADTAGTVPGFNALNVTSNQIVIPFNEYVRLNSPEKEILISPAPVMPPEFSVKGKKVYINLKDTLLPATTYTINFGKSVQDITESNATPHLQLVFSTGSFLDSALWKGVLLDAFSGAPAADIGVHLYRDTARQMPLSKRPDYYIRSDSRGVFEFRNIKPGPYRIVALDDQNGNRFQDLDNERFAFADSIVFIGGAETQGAPLRLYPIQGGTAFPALSWKPGRLALIGDTTGISFSTSWPASATVMFQAIPGNDSLFCYFAPQQLDTMQFTMTRTVNDSTVARSRTFRYPQRFRENLPKPRPYLTTGPMLEQGDTLTVLSRFPILQVDTALISLEGDSTRIQMEGVRIAYGQLKLHFKRSPGTRYRLMLKQGAVTDLNGMTNDSLVLPFQVRSPEYYGQLRFEIKGAESKSYIAELVNKSGKTVKRAAFTGNMVFDEPYLVPDTYAVRVTVDGDANGKWTSGDYVRRTQPETVLVYPELIAIRSNWQQDLVWEIQ
jgi:uncharacterized protein (DUF2141 family)